MKLRTQRDWKLGAQVVLDEDGRRVAVLRKNKKRNFVVVLGDGRRLFPKTHYVRPTLRLIEKELGDGTS